VIRKSVPRPEATLRRLCAIYGHLVRAAAQGQSRVTSFELGAALGVSAASIRRDIGTVGELGPSPVGYDVEQLRKLLENRTGVGRALTLCVVGLSWLGRALVAGADLQGCRIAAGFDSNTNLLETTGSRVPLYPTYEIEAVAQRERVDIALVAAVPQSPAETLRRLERGGVKGVLNLTGRPLASDLTGLTCVDVAIQDELRYLSMLLSLKEETE
jgi:NADH/NAD ratio-sensing transcriptional regulator Rex